MVLAKMLMLLPGLSSKNRKAICLCLLKKACWLDLKGNPEHKTLYRTYRSWYKHQVVPVSYRNPAAHLKRRNGLF